MILEPTGDLHSRIAHYNPAVVGGLYLSAVPVDGATGRFEFQIEDVPNDDPGSAGIFVDNDTFFDFTRLPLSADQHYHIAVWYYETTQEGEEYGESIFYVDAYPDG